MALKFPRSGERICVLLRGEPVREGRGGLPCASLTGMLGYVMGWSAALAAVLSAGLLAPAGARAADAQAPPPSGDILLLVTEAPNQPATTEVAIGLSNQLFRARRTSSIEVIDVRPVLPVQEAADRERIRRFGLGLAQRRFRVVVALGAEALGFLLRARAELWPDAGLIGAAITSEQSATFSGTPGLAILTADPPADAQVQLMRRLLPGARNIALVGGSSSLDRVAAEAMKAGIRRSGAGLNLIDLTGLKWAGLVEKVASLPPDTMILVASMLRDADGRSIPQMTVNELTRRAPAPVFSGSATFASGTIGGWGLNRRRLGAELGKIACRIQDGAAAGETSVTASDANQARVDWRQLQRWNIPLDRVPPGIRILNPPVPVWKSHPTTTLVVALLLLFGSVLLVLLVHDRRVKQRLRQEAEDRAAFEALIAELTSWFVSLPPDQVDERINAALERLAGAAGAPAVCLFSGEAGVLVRTHRWPPAAPCPDCVSEPCRNAERSPADTTWIRIEGKEREAGLLRIGVPPAVLERARGRLAGMKALGAAFLGALSRREAQRALEENEALGVSILKSLRTYLLVLDRNGVVVRSDCRASVVERDFDQFPFPNVSTGQDYPQALIGCGGDHPDCDRLVQAIRSALNGITNPPLEIRYGAGGPGTWAGIQVYPFEHAAGGAVLVHYDLTAEKRLETEYHEQFQQLTHMERVAALGQLASSLAHELNQPLAAVLANAQASLRLLRRPAPDLLEVNAALDDVISDVKRAAEVISQMRALLRKEPVRVDTHDAGPLAERIVNLMRTEAVLRKAALEFEPPGGPAPVECSSVQIGQVLMNLISNALDAVTSAAAVDRLITVGVRELRTEGLVEMTVRDRGPGLAPGELERVFEPFRTTKEGGLGVGLSICRSIVEQHGGTIQVENAAGGGCIFSVRLPSAAGKCVGAAGEAEHDRSRRLYR